MKERLRFHIRFNLVLAISFLIWGYVMEFRWDIFYIKLALGALGFGAVAVLLELVIYFFKMKLKTREEQ